MKRYLYLLLTIIGIFAVSCEPSTYIGFEYQQVTFDQHYTATSTKSSIIITMTKPQIIANGETITDFDFGVSYREKGSEPWNDVTDYTKNGDKYTYTIESLQPATTYEYQMWAKYDGSTHTYPEDYPFEIQTDNATSTCSITCTTAVEAKGLMATVNLTNVAYLVDDNEETIEDVTVEYKRTSAEEWVAKVFNGNMLNGGAMTVELPFEGENYLEENRDYELRVTLTPAADDLAPLTTKSVGFDTDYAEITANIAKPALSVDGEGIHAKVEGIKVFYDGVASEEYKDATAVKYYFYYRIKGIESWTTTEVKATNGTISATIPAEEGNTYEVKALIVAGAMQKARESAVAEIDVPKNETPTPTPPVGGGDTSAVAGIWHLTEWRGAEPSFDVYLDINAEGGLMLYQRIESRYWDIYSSTAAITDGVISGTYTDGTAWGASYNITISGDSMTWTDTSDSTDISVYTRATLPEDIATRGANISAVAATERFL